MNAPQIWIIVPGIFAIVAMVFRRWRRISGVIGAMLAVSLAGLAWIVPIGEKFKLLFWTIEISNSLTVLGRRFILTTNDRIILILIYSAAAFWIIGALVSTKNHIFTPISIGISALLVAALAIEPFLYAAIILEMVVLVCAILLIKPGKTRNRGVVRFLSLQSLAMPFILFSGWLLSGVEVNPEDSTLVLQAAILMAIGFGLFFSIFPFHSWIPLVAEEADPIPGSFVFYVLPLAIGLLGITFLERFTWLYTTPWLYVYLRFSGVLMVILGSLWAAIQNNLARLFGFTVILEIGLTLLMLSLGLGSIQNRPLMALFFTASFPRGISYGLWALSLSIVKNDRNSLDYQAIRGIVYEHPMAVTGFTLAVFSLIGIPLTAGYNPMVGVWQYLNELFPLAANVSIFGSIGLTIGLFRALANIFQSTGEVEWRVHEKMGERILIVLACIGLIVFGIFPQLYTSSLVNLGLAFLNISP